MIDPDYKHLLRAWGIQFSELDASVLIEGSPERTAARAVVRDSSGNRWILEQITEDNLPRKREIAEQLVALSVAGLEKIHPWQKTRANSFFQTLEKSMPAAASGFQGLEKSHWMLRPYVDGIQLDRETYLSELWRMDVMADFLIRLRAYTEEWSGFVFSIADYAEHRMAVWRERYPQLTDKFERSFSKLKQNFFPLHDSLPTAFCHGDYHPLNMVWGEKSIRSVIDWEFCGIKPELYDAALLVGCIGFEDPDNLIKEPVIRLIKTLQEGGYGATESWDRFLDLAATIRFGWMSEWIRRKDHDALEMESIYIDILVDQQDYISNAWKNYRSL